MSQNFTLRCKDCSSDYEMDVCHERYDDAVVLWHLRKPLAEIARLKEKGVYLYELRVNVGYVHDVAWFAKHDGHRVVVTNDLNEEFEPEMK